MEPCAEKKGIFNNSLSRPGDVTLPSWSHARPLAIDVAVTSPFTVFGMPKVDPHDAYATTHKHGRNDIKFRGHTCDFGALVLETTGGIGAEATLLLKQVFRFASRQQNVPHSVYAGR